MPIFDKHKLIFHHVPKTGGRAITEWLGHADAHVGHLPIIHLNNQLIIWEHTRKGILPDRKNYQTFTVMRSPLERIRSGFEHVKNIKSHEKGENALLKEKFKENFEGDLNKFLLSDNLLEIVMDRNATMLHPTTWMFCEETKDPKNPLVHAPDFVLLFDQLENDCSYMVEKLKLDVKKPFKSKRTSRVINNLSGEAYRRARWVWEWEFKIYEFFTSNFYIKNIL